VNCEKLKKIRLLLLDVDGVMTDGRIVYDANGVETKFFNVKDGHGIKMLQRGGIEVGIISGRQSQVVDNRAAELGITIVYQKALDKLTPYQEILAAKGLKDEHVAFMGDDIIDIPVMRRVGFAAAPADAMEYVLEHAHFVSRNRGGWGAVRELCDLILKSVDTWNAVTERYYR
jgi:3-deoxy-D-manno-octulosonate 8-phosphate phosphatase (KDO 8-P phosphatase)